MKDIRVLTSVDVGLLFDISTGVVISFCLAWSVFPNVTCCVSVIDGVELFYHYRRFGCDYAINSVAGVRNIVCAGLVIRLTHELNRLIITYLKRLVQNL